MSTIDTIIELLEKQNKKQKELTDYLGISKNALTDWKSGRIKSYTKHLPKIAEFFGVSVDYLLGVEKPHKPINNMLRTPEEEAELNEYLEALHNDPNLRMMFSLAKDAKKEDVEKAVAIIKTLLGKD